MKEKITITTALKRATTGQITPVKILAERHTPGTPPVNI